MSRIDRRCHGDVPNGATGVMATVSGKKRGMTDDGEEVLEEMKKIMRRSTTTL